MCDPIGYMEAEDEQINICGIGGDERLQGKKHVDYVGCQSKTRSGKTCQSWDSQTPHAHNDKRSDFDTQGHNYCRNPYGKQETIWCYTADPNTPWELCDPVGAPVFKDADDFARQLKKRNPARRRKNKGKKKRRIDAEIVKISPAGIMDIDFSETLHGFKHFE